MTDRLLWTVKSFLLFGVLAYALSNALWAQSGAADLTTQQQALPGSGNASQAHNTNRNSPSAILPSTSGRFFDKTGSLLLGQGDLIHVDVLQTPDFSQDVRLDSSGGANLSGMGPLQLGDKTTDQASQIIANRLMELQLMNHPQVAVSLIEFVAQGVALRGEFKNVGVFTLIGQHPLADLIAIGGGITELGNGKLDIRHSHDTTVEHTSIEASDAVSVYPGDEITAVRAGLVYILGNVNRPGGFPLNRPTTIVQAMTLAQGTKQSTKDNDLQVFRVGNGPSGRVQIEVKLHDILRGKEPDFPLQEGDIVYVPLSNIKYSANIAVTSALAFAAQAAILIR